MVEVPRFKLLIFCHVSKMRLRDIKGCSQCDGAMKSVSILAVGLVAVVPSSAAWEIRSPGSRSNTPTPAPWSPAPPENYPVTNYEPRKQPARIIDNMPNSWIFQSLVCGTICAGVFYFLTIFLSKSLENVDKMHITFSSILQRSNNQKESPSSSKTDYHAAM